MSSKDREMRGDKPSDREADSRRRIEEDERRHREREPVGTKEEIPGYGQAPEGVRTLRLPDEAPRKKPGERDEDVD